jgi:translation elongation factor EF-Ts
VIDKIVEGKLNSFYEQACLMDQPVGSAIRK